jgi:hypothetical protein
MSHYAGPFLRSIAANPHIEEVRCDNTVGLPYQDFLAFLREKESTLKHLALYVNFNGNESELSRAFGALQVLNHLSLVYGSVTPLQALILQSLCFHSSLQCLSVAVHRCQSDDIVDALVSFLQSTTVLHTLVMMCFSLDAVSMESVVRGLAGCPTLRHLEFRLDFEDVDMVAMDLLVRFFQTRNMTPTIESLKFGNIAGPNPPLFRKFAAMLTAPESPASHPLSTGRIGCTLQSLSLDCDCDEIEDLLKVLTKGACRLSSLHLGSPEKSAPSHLVQYLPDFCYLRELSTDGYAGKGYDGALGLALRKNGSLHAVKICADIETDSEQIQAYVQRNRLVPLFLGRKPLVGKNDDSDDMVARALFLFPSMFHAVKPAARTAPGILLIGLLAGSDSLGDSGDMKRNSVSG